MIASESAALVDTVVIGAGLSGLTVTHLLLSAGKSVRLLEARSRVGGRIGSVVDTNGGLTLGDLGPTWVWPEYQPVVREWIDRLGIETFPQYESGSAIFDAGPDTRPQIVNLPGQAGIERIVGGPRAIVDALMALIPSGTLISEAVVTQVSKTSDGLLVQTEDGSAFRAKCVVCAVPARLAQSTIQWEPALVPALDQLMRQTPTWMASQAKAIAVYKHAFWREQGLSGRIASQAGPLFEAHDHCGAGGSPAAIFGFLGWPPPVRQQRVAALKNDIRKQLIRCFGERSPVPLRIYVQDWANEKFTTSEHDIIETRSHPEVAAAIARQAHADNTLWFAGAELAVVSPGLIEGALDSAQRTVQAMLS